MALLSICSESPTLATETLALLMPVAAALIVTSMDGGGLLAALRFVGDGGEAGGAKTLGGAAGWMLHGRD